jgi:uncharacterized membrane protein YhiD involved in acid resistance
MFVVIGIGLAAGTQLLIVAFVVSVMFNVLILTLARTGYATNPRQLTRFTLTAAAPRPDTQSRRTVNIRADVSDEARARRCKATLPIRGLPRSATSP